VYSVFSEYKKTMSITVATRNWEAVVFEIIRENYFDKQFTRKDLIKNHLGAIVEGAQSIGTTPEQTLSRVLQFIRNRGYLQFKGRGVYEMTKLGIATKHICTDNRSKGEKLVCDILGELGITFQEQVRININTIPGAKPRYLIFDFRFHYNNIEYAIEFDGLQHLKPVDIFGGVEAWRRQVIRDKRKDRYCRDRSIIMIRVSDMQYNVCKRIITYYLQPVDLNMLF
jgi:hypothetical protein